MLEKIGLPAKPSLRGNNWVVDASNCQGCSSQFTFINRKHHCRRCGGIFCSSCTQQRMVLLGQGDSPVRICEPCKKLEEAARFERRHVHKRRAGRGASKMSLNSDQVLNKILGNDGKDFFSPERDSATQTVSGIQDVATQDRGDQLHKASSANEPGEMVSDSPEKLLQQASDEKRKYKILKGEGKPEEALSAFKRGKELERQAAALERSLRKSRRKDPSSSSKTETHKIKDDFRGNDHRTSCNQIGKEKDGFAAELRELGWSDRDLRDGDEQPAATSWEGELSSLIAETSNVGKRLEVTNKTEVIALKKRALSLKREGKLGEAKEELKKAKILEKQLEEQEFLARDEDSDDELSTLIRSIEGDKQDFSIQSGQSSFGIDDLESIADDLGVDGNFEVTDEDMDDPEMAAALKSLGWTEDSNKPEGDGSQVAHEDDREEIFSKIRTLKREALSNKRSGHTVEAMALLRKAKVLEKDLDALNSRDAKLLPLKAENPPNLNDMVDNEKAHQLGGDEPRMAPKNKIKIQRELLGVKKKVLALKREGKTEEAEEELSKGKVLEQQLEELENASKMAARPENITNWDSDILKKVDLKDGGEEDCVTDQDLHDPTYLSFLKNLGWRDEESDITNVKSEVSTPVSSAAPTTSVSRSKGEIQRELLGLKRKALGLRRQGQAEAAEEVLIKAKALEAQMAEMDAPKRSVVEQNEHMESESMKPSAPTVIPSNSASKPMSSRDRFKLQQTSLSHKRQALKLRREGRTEEAEAEFKLAKDLESQLEEPPPAAAGGFGAERVGELLDPQLLSALQNVGMGNADVESQSRAIPEVNVEKSESSAPEIVRLEKQIKDEKIEAVKLKRSGKKAEALDALRRAKVLEKKLDSTVAH